MSHTSQVHHIFCLKIHGSYLTQQLATLRIKPVGVFWVVTPIGYAGCHQRLG
jgi:hypothetical protein